MTDDIIRVPERYQKICDGKILAALFFEPSTRTRLSFESAMHRLGGSVVGFTDPMSSSTAKGESIGDTIRMISGYADIAVMRHSIEGAPKAASLYSEIPVVNAGDGGHQHPTQTLTDLYTIRSARHELNSLKIGLCGDLKFGRTVHSLIEATSRYEDITYYLISPEELSLPKGMLEALKKNPNVTVHEVRNIEDAIENLDILYMTRIQRERFSDKAEYDRLRDFYVLDREKMKKAKPDMLVLHPLPRVNEIAPEVDEDPRAAYFLQAKYGLYVRMALILKMTRALDGIAAKEKSDLSRKAKKLPEQFGPDDLHCTNSRCITSSEHTLPKRFQKISDTVYRCEYCDRIIKI